MDITFLLRGLAIAFRLLRLLAQLACYAYAAHWLRDAHLVSFLVWALLPLTQSMVALLDLV